MRIPTFTHIIRLGQEMLENAERLKPCQLYVVQLAIRFECAAIIYFAQSPEDMSVAWNKSASFSRVADGLLNLAKSLPATTEYKH